jgi:hypothetical protein
MAASVSNAKPVTKDDVREVLREILFSDEYRAMLEQTVARVISKQLGEMAQQLDPDTDMELNLEFERRLINALSEEDPLIDATDVRRELGLDE